MKKSLEAFIFDLDGVITDTAEYHYQAWKALAGDLGISFSRDLNEHLKGVSRMESLEKILAWGGRQADFSDDEKHQLATRKNDHYLTLIQKITPADILPGITELLKDVKAGGFKLGLASASKNAFTVLESLGLIDRFDVIVDAREITKGKPDPEIFLTAARLLDVDPAACIGVEDAAAGVESIKSAGMFAVAVGPRESFPGADLVYPETSQLSLEAIKKAYFE